MSTSGNIPAAPPGWYTDPAGTGRLRWWDGFAWTDQFSTPAQPVLQGWPAATSPYAGTNPYTQAGYPGGPHANVGFTSERPLLRRDAPVYNPLIWVITLLPLLSTVLLLLWTPEFRFIRVGRQQTLDPWSLFTPAYFLLLFSGFAAYAASIVLAWFDSQGLTRDGVVRPFHWAWSFLSSAVYVIGRSVIMAKVARGRGLVPIWVLIAVFVLNIVVTNIKMSALMSSMIETIPA
ncbi:DUF2510 domain-containing protein [Pseudarthrobacter sp. H3Y2-7]|uniref:DUF2510 domain-containing protein n=1 Tax=Pseudarthrobacter naphthalenicus TaxID=3031328 RepID=UPI0023B085D6|nr:DUF2510 domain-containing protein [Pseudarthrobacter sp. H3Y2-7]MDE8668581.1 DUF2510 domain-containing protein [Pseudarthrobacter sp. H3Y2-7]